MKMRTRYLRSICLFFLAVGLAILAGCAAKQRIQALFTKPELLGCGRLAVLGLSPEQEQIFMSFYIRVFPGQIITFVERNRLHEVLSEQDLLEGRLDEKTRAKIKQLFGVEALIMCTYYDGTTGVGARKKLRIRVVDSSTGAILGSVITQARDDFEYHCRIAVKALKADVMGETEPDRQETPPVMRRW